MLDGETRIKRLGYWLRAAIWCSLLFIYHVNYIHSLQHDITAVKGFISSELLTDFQTTIEIFDYMLR